MAPHRIEVRLKREFPDAPGMRLAARAAQELEFPVQATIRTAEVYTIEDDLPAGELQMLAGEVFTDAIVCECSVDAPVAKSSDFDYAVEVGFKPGVTDNVGRTAREAIEDALGRKLSGGVYSSTQYLLAGVDAEGAQAIAKGLLANELIERWAVKSSAKWGGGFPAVLPTVELSQSNEGRVEQIPLGGGDEELLETSRRRLLALSIGEMRAVRDYFSRTEVKEERAKAGMPGNPTDAELEAIAQTWSEHCKHKIFNAVIDYEDAEAGSRMQVDSLFKTFIRAATLNTPKPWLVSVFVDNAGIIEFDGENNFAIKVETHNSPSALDPYGGALTGIVGVNRDVLGAGLGARLIFNTDVFCFAPPHAQVPHGVLPPKRIFEGVRKGVQDGGNKSGVPTVNGCIVFHESFAARPLVYCGTGGIMPKKAGGLRTHEKSVKAGDLIVMCGGRIGKDGIHGATFSSLQMDEHSPVSAVQLGDPITQKKMADFLLEARDEGLFTAITDNGAGGLSSSIGEMAQLSGGFELHLEKAPLKYPGLAPWEILVSEAQERMTLAVPPEKFARLLKLAQKHGVEATEIGKFTESGKFHCLHGGKPVAYVDMEFMHGGVPQMNLKARWERPKTAGGARDELMPPEPDDYNALLKRLLSRYNVCSKERVVRQYDHEVQGGSAVKPLEGARNDGPSDAGVLRPVLSSQAGIVVSNGICPRYSRIDAYAMAACAVDEALRNYVATGGSLSHVAALDNFSWCDPLPSKDNPEAEYKLAQLVRACTAVYDACTAYGMPLVSGKDSMKNDYVLPDGTRKSILPTLLVTAVGKIMDVGKAVTIDAKREGDLVYVLGTTRNELGASEYFEMLEEDGGSVPRVDYGTARALYSALEKAIAAGLAESCHDASDGGIGVALAETAFAGGLGLNADLRKIPRESGVARDDCALFSESASRFVVTVRPENVAAFEEAMGKNAFGLVGAVGPQNGNLRVFGMAGKTIIDCPADELKKAWQSPLGI